MDARQTAQKLMTLALDTRTPEKERIAAAFQALKVIDKHGLLESPLDGIMEIDNEIVSSVSTILKAVLDPEVRKSAKTIIGKARRRR